MRDFAARAWHNNESDQLLQERMVSSAVLVSQPIGSTLELFLVEQANS